MKLEENEWVLEQLPPEQCKNRGTPARKTKKKCDVEPGFTLIEIPSQIVGLSGGRVGNSILTQS